MATVHRIAESGRTEATEHTHTQVKETNLKSYIPYDSNYMIFCMKQNYGHSKKISVCRGYREEGKQFYRTLLRKESLTNE